MEKILVVINAHKPDVVTIDFACRMAAMAKTKLTGLFIENLYYKYAPAKVDQRYFETVSGEVEPAIMTDTDQAVRLFVDECRKKKVQENVYIDKGEPIQEVIYESRFADLLIVDPQISFYDREEQLPSHFVREILASAECPVVLAPGRIEDIDEIIFCYDGSASSVYAIKQFTYLVPEFNSKKLMLLEVDRSAKDDTVNDSHRRMMDWLKAHYAVVYRDIVAGDAKDELFNFLFMKSKKLVVLGAYGRSILSKFFKPSAADVLIRTIDLPIFITHY